MVMMEMPAMMAMNDALQRFTCTFMSGLTQGLSVAGADSVAFCFGGFWHKDMDTKPKIALKNVLAFCTTFMCVQQAGCHRNWWAGVEPCLFHNNFNEDLVTF